MTGVLWALSVVACAAPAHKVAEDCVEAGKRLLSGRFSLTINAPAERYELSVVNQWRQGELVLTATNDSGIRVFRGVLQEGNIVITDESRLYKGPDAEVLLWGLLTQQLREQLPSCGQAREYQIDQDGQQVQLQRQGMTVFESRTQHQFLLPGQRLDVRIRRLN